MRKHPKDWMPFPTDNLDPEKLRELVKQKGILCKWTDKNPEAKATYKRMCRLIRIAQLEAEASGEDPWNP